MGVGARLTIKTRMADDIKLSVIKYNFWIVPNKHLFIFYFSVSLKFIPDIQRGIVITLFDYVGPIRSVSVIIQDYHHSVHIY